MSKCSEFLCTDYRYPLLIFNTKELLPFLPILLLCPCLTPLSCPSHTCISHILEHVMISHYDLDKVAFSWPVGPKWASSMKKLLILYGVTNRNLAVIY